MNQKFAFLLRVVFMVLDIMMLNTVYFVTKWYLLNVDLLSNDGAYITLWIVINVTWLLCAAIHSLYEGTSTHRFETFMRKSAHTYFLFLVVTLIYLYFTHQMELSRIFVCAFLSFYPACILINRLMYLFTWLHFRNKENLIKRIMIIGYNDIGKQLATHFEKNNTHMKLIGYCEEYSKVNELSRYPIVSTPNNAMLMSQELKITEIYSTILPEQDHRIYDLMQKADQACIRFKLVPDFGLFVNKPMHVNYMSGMPVLTARTEPLDDLVNRIKKRLFDISVSLFATIFILSWLIPLIALAIWLESRGPIFFVQKRSGLNNKAFNCIKFRSMKVNTLSNLVQARRNDDRLTGVGRFLRKTNLDEFPQFINVLRGNMSIVGPRPHMLKHTEDYSALISRYMVRQFLKPGITGWAQVNGLRGETRRLEDMQARVDHDIWYMENWTMYLDLKIMAMTVYNIFKGEDNAF
ncbi:undecaprenyl-phosphate glucose phosphotransferase [Flavitalea sp.]|nr:undecaprenyl-phosphate glucose phosphotransferase [Flavitalea sp.]